MSAMSFTEDQKAQLAKDGFIVLPKLLSTGEVARIREAALDHLNRHAVFVDGGTTQMDAFNQIPALRWLATDAKVLDAFRYFCGETLEYCHHSDVHMNKFTGWHRDNHGHDDWRVAPPAEAFAVYKMAVYLQDHSQGPTALHVVRGSHLEKGKAEGEVVELRPAIGDVVLFDIRIRHKGEEKSLFGKVFSRISPSRAATTRVLQSLRNLEGKGEKLSVFFTYARPNALTDEHIDLTIRRQLDQSGGKGYELDPGLRDQLVNAGIVVHERQA